LGSARSHRESLRQSNEAATTPVPLKPTQQRGAKMKSDRVATIRPARAALGLDRRKLELQVLQFIRSLL
jgi:hypothetical protein